jgi:hypothetical protein
LRACILSLAMSPALAAISGHDAQAQSLPTSAATGCFNVIPAQAGVQPAILIDRCGGGTWQLVARHRGGGMGRRHAHVVYVWSPIDRGEREVAHVSPPPPVKAPAPAAAPRPPRADSSKCFSFNGRTYCE